MATVRALDLPLGPGLLDAIITCHEQGIAFCVLDQRLSPRRAKDELTWLGATEVLDVEGTLTAVDGGGADDGIGLVMLTSGSSGQPKAAQLTWDALTASARLTTEALQGPGRPVWYPCLPANHIGGLAVLLRIALADAGVVWGLPEDVTRGPAYGATHVAAVRTQLARFDLSDYQTVLLGGARPPGNVGPNVIATWGMTETGSGVVYNGRPLPGVDVAVVDGELCLRTPTLFQSYRDRPRPSIVGPDGRDDWFPTGDGGTFRHGLVHVQGRLDYVINSGGEKIWPDDLESVFMAMKGVREAAVTALPDDEWGDRLVALLVTDGTVTDEDVRDVATYSIGPWAKPKEIRYVAALPRTSNGKLRRDQLAHLH